MIKHWCDDIEKTRIRSKSLLIFKFISIFKWVLTICYGWKWFIVCCVALWVWCCSLISQKIRYFRTTNGFIHIGWHILQWFFTICNEIAAVARNNEKKNQKEFHILNISGIWIDYVDVNIHRPCVWTWQLSSTAIQWHIFSSIVRLEIHWYANFVRKKKKRVVLIIIFFFVSLRIPMHLFFILFFNYFNLLDPPLNSNGNIVQ